MATLDFLLSNDRHHADMLAPVVERLAGDGHRCRVMSLCELRGMRSPRQRFRFPNVSLHRLFPPLLRSAAGESGAQTIKSSSTLHSTVRRLLWHLALRPRLASFWGRKPAVVVTPNDAAFPYDRITALLRRRGTPFVLLQEGVRFRLPGVPPAEAYGAGGASAIAAWGASSADYFLSVGADPATIHLTGSPRFDAIRPRARKRDGRPQNLLLITNPIDDQGFCTTEEKHALVRRFVDGLAPLLEERDLKITLKLHAGESPELYRRALASSPAFASVELATALPLVPLLEGADAAVVLASTVGLEAILLGVPLGVLEIPGTGFAFDFVSAGAAQGLAWDRPTAMQVTRLLDDEPPSTAAYLSRHLAIMGHSTEAVARLIDGLAHSTASSE